MSPFVVVVAGTGTDVGKTWVTCRLAEYLRAQGMGVSARKPAQSFEPGTPAEATDAGLLAQATGEETSSVCPPHRWYNRPMAPPMAAASIGAPVPSIADLAAEVTWGPAAAVGLVELAGGLGSPLGADGDGVDLIALLAPDLVVLVSRPGLGALGEVRLSARALGPGPALVVFLNRYQAGDELHWRNRAWLEQPEGLRVAVTIGQLVEAVAQRLASR